VDPVAAFGWEQIAQNALIVGIVSTAVWPTALMRACAARDATVVRRLYVWSSVGFLTRWIIPQFLGVCALASMWGDPRVPGSAPWARPRQPRHGGHGMIAWMTPEAWLAVWTSVLPATLVVFTGLAATVAVGALFDLRRMLRELGRQRDDP
jgi:hypothetical protein